MIRDHFGDAEAGVGTAVFSDDRRHRYSLTRQWAPGFTIVWIMLNPSTADARVLDPTIRRCVAFSKREGAGALAVVNAFSIRATRPVDMLRADDPGDDRANDDAIRRAVRSSEFVVAAWGVHAVHRQRDLALRELLARETQTVFALKVTKDGMPGHPLYVKGDAPLLSFDASY